tara:strand:+ start:396 stop:602 length:207 start_codon:yes stop_codon:yes gene_type:complete
MMGPAVSQQLSLAGAGTVHHPPQLWWKANRKTGLWGSALLVGSDSGIKDTKGALCANRFSGDNKGTER